MLFAGFTEEETGTTGQGEEKKRRITEERI